MTKAKTKKRMTFTEWVDRKGANTIAQMLGVGPATVRHWRANRCDPRVEQIRKIKILTRGLIGYEQIIDRRVTTKSKR